jgi:hypothetical protein
MVVSIRFTTLSNIKETNILVQDNNAVVSNDQNDTFSKALINVYILGVCNLERHVYNIIPQHMISRMKNMMK